MDRLLIRRAADRWGVSVTDRAREIAHRHTEHCYGGSDMGTIHGRVRVGVVEHNRRCDKLHDDIVRYGSGEWHLIATAPNGPRGAEIMVTGVNLKDVPKRSID